MDIQKIHQYKSAFDQIAKDVKDDEGNSIEVWYARELQTQLDYARWEIFVVAIGRAMEARKTLGISADGHFHEVTKMVQLSRSKHHDQAGILRFQYTVLNREFQKSLQLRYGHQDSMGR